MSNLAPVADPADIAALLPFGAHSISITYFASGAIPAFYSAHICWRAEDGLLDGATGRGDTAADAVANALTDRAAKVADVRRLYADIAAPVTA